MTKKKKLDDDPANSSKSLNSSTSFWSEAHSQGVGSAAHSQGTFSLAHSVGDLSAAHSQGECSGAHSEGKYATAASVGYCGRVMGDDGNALFLVYRNWETNEILHAWAGIVGCDGIKPNVGYVLDKDGKPQELP